MTSPYIRYSIIIDLLVMLIKGKYPNLRKNPRITGQRHVERIPQNASFGRTGSICESVSKRDRRRIEQFRD
jgi:hypothetical protein